MCCKTTESGLGLAQISNATSNENGNMVIRLAKEKKIGVVLLWKNNEAFFSLTSEKRAELSEEWNEIKSRWKEKAKLVVSQNTVGTGKFDGFEVWEVTELRDWKAFHEAALRCWNKYLEYYESYIGINTP